MRTPAHVAAACALALVAAQSALASNGSWAAPEIRAVTQAGVLGQSPGTFRPQAPLTESALARAIAATDAVLRPPLPAPPAPAPLSILSTIADGATLAGVVVWEVDAPGQNVDHVDFAVDGVGLATEHAAPYDFDLGAGGLDTRALTDGPHSLAANVAFAGGGYAVAVWSITVDNSTGAAFGVSALAAVPIAKSWLPPLAETPGRSRRRGRCTAPSRRPDRCRSGNSTLRSSAI